MKLSWNRKACISTKKFKLYLDIQVDAKLSILKNEDKQ